MTENIAIEIRDLSKKYRIGSSKSGNLRETFSNLFSTNKDKSSHEDYWALKDLSLDINKGEAVGIIGKNGAGKSTLLKILSQITQPTTGSAVIHGRVSSLLEVGTGFHPELTGKENIYLNGTILGMSRKEIKSRFDEIVAFSGVEKFLYTPVKHYSSGMYVRLAFSVAAHLEPEILIIDEVLAVGDADFQKKCLGKMEDVANKGRTVIFVSHNMNAVSQLCTRAVWLRTGEVVMDMKDTPKVISSYINQNGTTSGAELSLLDNLDVANSTFTINKIALTNKAGEIHQKNIHFSEPIDVRISGEIMQNKEILNFCIVLYSSTKTTIFSSWMNKSNDKIQFNQSDTSFEVIAKIPAFYLNEGLYYLELTAVLDNQGFLIKKGEGPMLSFEISGGQQGNLINPGLNWELTT